MSDIPDEIQHLADSIGHVNESVQVLDAVVEFAEEVDMASDKLNKVLYEIMKDMDNLSPELQEWLIKKSKAMEGSE